MNTILYIFIAFYALFQSPGDLEKNVIEALRNGEGKALSSFFASSVKLYIDGEEHVSNKNQSELILSDYFSANKLSDIKKSPLCDNSSNCLILDAKSNKKPIRILFKLIKLKNSEYISEIRVE